MSTTNNSQEQITDDRVITGWQVGRPMHRLVGIRLAPEMFEQIATVAAQESRTYSNVCRCLINEALQHRRQQASSSNTGG